MQYEATNPAQNITLGEAQEFITKLTNLGFFPGPIHVNPEGGGANAGEMIPVSDVLLDMETAYNLVFQTPANPSHWHNIALMKRRYGKGTMFEFQHIADELGVPGQVAVTKLPGFVAAVEKLIKQA